MNPEHIILLALVGFAVGTAVGHAIGYRRGRDAQWLDDYFARTKQDRERRDRGGRFIAIKGKEARTS